MAAGTFTVYGAAIEAIHKGLIDLDSSTVVITLHGSSYTPSNDTHATWADVSASQFSTGGNYTAGGQALANITVTRTGSTVKFDADDVTWSNVTLANVRYAIATVRAGASLASTDLLLGYCDVEVGGSLSPSNGNLAITWNANGLFQTSRA